jgi:head-tail adaptor
VSVLAAGITRDAFGAEVLTWAPTGQTLWAKVVERGGREPLIADRPVMVVSYEIILRYTAITAALTHLHRLRWGQKTLQIETVTPERTTGCVRLRTLEVAP